MNTPRDLATPLQRISWRDGQVLLSSDLRDDVHSDEHLRHLHIRYQHKTWGIVAGLQVVPLGTTAVVVEPGYALDINGCDLLRPQAMRVPLPADITVSATMYLVLSRGERLPTCATTPDLAALCPGEMNATSLEEGDLEWKTVTQVRPGADVLLARMLIAGGHLASAVDTSVQRRAATADRPRTWSDATQRGQTGWIDVRGTKVREIQAAIDTSNAGFIAMPAYFACLAGGPPVASAFISTAGPTSFTFVVRVSGAVAPATKVNAARAESSGWTVSWFAVALPSKDADPLTAQSRGLP
jgi:hypothetical protein